MSFSFETIQKRAIGSSFPEGIVRVNKHTITFSEEASQALGLREGTFFSIGWDAYNQALKITTVGNPLVGFKIARSNETTKTLTTALPLAARRRGILHGDYAPVEAGVYQLVK